MTTPLSESYFRDSGPGTVPQGHDPTEPPRSHSIYNSVRFGESQMRLLQLLPGRHQDPIHCTLLAVKSPASDPQETIRDQIPPEVAYEALSYVWASDEDDAVISVNHIPFSISANVYHAFKCFRLADKARVLWVDAICINQEDTQEKSEQVRMMDRIYSNADTVLIYLGPDVDDSSLVMDYLTVDDSDLLDNDGVLFTEASARKTRAEKRDLRLSTESERVFLANYFTSRGMEENRVVQAAYAFFCRPYWTRMWVVQEAKLAKRDPVWYCGRRSTTMQRLRERLPALHNFTLYKKQPAYVSIEEALGADPRGRRKPYEELMGWCRSAETIFFTVDPEASDDLSTWLDRCSARKSTDPRDRVFALVSMLDPFAKRVLAPDYSMSAAQVFFLATVYVLTHEYSTQVFALYSFTRAHHNASFSLDFTRPFPGVASTEFFAEYKSAYWFAKPVDTEIADGKLILSGIDFDTIRVASNIDEGVSNFQCLKTIRMRERMLGKYARLLVRPKVTPSPQIMSALLLAPAYEREVAINNDITALQGLDEYYLEMLQAIAPSRSELPGTTHFICQMLKAVATHVAGSADRVRCQYRQQQNESPSKITHHKDHLQAVMAIMTPYFLSAAAFELSELESVMDRFKSNQVEISSKTSPSTTSTTSSFGRPQLKATFRATQSQEELDTLKSLAGQRLASAYAEAKALLRGTMASCTCGGSEREAHRVELEARHHAISQEELMFKHVVEFLRQRRVAEYFSAEALAVERQNKAMFVTEAHFFGISFQHDPGFEEGDKLVLMNGFLAPIILREVDGGGKFRIKGVTYVAGLSDVDIESLIEDGVLQEERFEIS
ncbi:heterokaryon incompatibility protein-domain-containing protein [Nemania abortiva]|nr:heterokaryon incompatibility protein-domain-containing protein [Nemania abortiva]